MFKLFKKLTAKSDASVIEAIHNEFDTATERLLSEAKSIIANSDKIKADKANRLKKLGFSQSKSVIETDEQIKAEKESEAVANNIMYFQTHYPNNKFITEQEVEKICKKYGLVCGEVRYYKGDVPEKNLMEIEQFKLREEDTMYWVERGHSSRRLVDEKTARKYEDENKDHDRLMDSMREYSLGMINRPRHYYVSKARNEFKICASVKDFDANRMTIEKGYKLQEIPDPIVLQPVKDGYLIVSKWGLEASDEIVVNEKMN